MGQVQRIAIANLLAGNPTQPPRYARKVRTRQGYELSVADPRATRAMVALMDMQAVMGGAAAHFGGPAAFAELMSALHALVFARAEQAGRPWYELFHLINDAGHCENGLYALKANYAMAGLSLQTLKGFRSLQSHLTGHGESHLFPQGVYLSNGPLGSSLAQSQGLAFADAKANVQRITVNAISDGASFEGEAREAYAAIPGLAARGLMAPFVCIISDNNTKLTGRIASDSFDMQPTFKSLSTLGWKVLHLEQGNNLEQCVLILEQAFVEALKDPTQPVVVHAKTIKGFGVKQTVESASGGHGFPLKKATELAAFLQEIYGEDAVPEEFLKWAEEMVTQEKALPKAVPSSGVKEKVQVGVAKALVAARSQGLPIVAVTSDLAGSTGVGGFIKAYPEEAVDVGVAESNMMSMAAGLSKQGYIPVVDTFAQFGVTKGALPLTMAALSQAPMIAFFSHTGFQDAADGASHQALSYFAMVSSIPHVEVYALASSQEAESLVGQALLRFYEERSGGKVPKSVIFFFGREDFAQSYCAEPSPYRLGKAQVINDTSAEHQQAVAIVAAGPLLAQGLEAAERLVQKGIGSIVIHPSIINAPDLETIIPAIKKCEGRLLTVEDHQLIAGMGAQLIHALVLARIPLKAKSLGVSGHFGQSAYSALELYKKHGLDAESIARAALELF